MPVIRLVHAVVVRATSHVRQVARYEIAILRRLFPEADIRVRSIPSAEAEANGYTLDVKDARFAKAMLRDKYGPAVDEAYPDDSFAAEFDAVAKKDALGAADGLDREGDWTALTALCPAITPLIAETLFRKGIRSVADVLAASSDDLESAGLTAVLAETVMLAAKGLEYAGAEASEAEASETADLSDDPLNIDE